MLRKLRKLVVTCSLTVCFLSSSLAMPQAGGPGRKPPQEALEACSGKQVNDSCEFTSPMGDKITGTCFLPPNMKKVACRPSKALPEQH